MSPRSVALILLSLGKEAEEENITVVEDPAEVRGMHL